MKNSHNTYSFYTHVDKHHKNREARCRQMQATIAQLSHAFDEQQKHYLVGPTSSIINQQHVYRSTFVAPIFQPKSILKNEESPKSSRRVSFDTHDVVFSI